MYVVLLKFAARRDQAARYMEGHNAWLRRGFDEGAFLLSGSLKPGLGGLILAQAATREDLEARIAADPFVSEGVVAPDILDVAPSKADERLAFLLG